MKPRHLYAPPVIDAKALARELAKQLTLEDHPEILQAQLAFRPPNLLPVEYDNLDMYQLYEDYFYTQKVKGKDSYLPREEKKGRLVDGASVPRPAWSFCPPDGRHRRAAFHHDLDYQLKALPKAEADLEFRRRLLEDGVATARVLIIYRMVKWFGNPDHSVARWSVPLYKEDT